MQLEFSCPGCGLRSFDFNEYQSMILLSPGLALMQFDCPVCGLELSVTTKIPAHIQRKIKQRFLDAEDVIGTALREPSGRAGQLGQKDEDPATVTSTSCWRPGIVRYSANLDPSLLAETLRVVRPVPAADNHTLAHIEYFRRQLESVETVDEAISEIDAGYFDSGNFRTKES